MSKRTPKNPSSPASSPPLSVSALSIPPLNPTTAEKKRSKKVVQHAVDEVVEEEFPREYVSYIYIYI